MVAHDTALVHLALDTSQTVLTLYNLPCHVQLGLLVAIHGYHERIAVQFTLQVLVVEIAVGIDQGLLVIGILHQLQHFRERVAELLRRHAGIGFHVEHRNQVLLGRQTLYLEIVQLPFNSGLSRGLNAALKKVSTPYVMRMDDDELFTCRTKLVQQLHFLKNHEDIGLVGFGVRDSLRWNSLKKRYNTYAKQTMHNAGRATSVAPMTRIDEAHVVFAKVPNVFLARTELVKKVGYDNNVRMLDHNDFFFRASGVIVSVLAEDTIIYHRHNFFDKGYMMFRNDTARDLQIINRSRNIESSG